MNEWAAKEVPFLFIVDFEMQKPLIYRLDEIERAKLLYAMNGIRNHEAPPIQQKFSAIRKTPIPFSVYNDKYQLVKTRLTYGDSYLTNLTVKTEVDTSASLQEIFFISNARYKLWFNDEFLVFSPETFVRIEGGRISAYPMKGTIDADLPGAAAKILADRKEFAEHVTIVDLIRNDLSGVASNVQVSRFRYLDTIKTSDKTLLQVSSEIQGDLLPGYGMGDVLVALLPAGSVSGAPKPKTVEIIRHAEGEPRGYYTGVMGIFDGKSLDSGVMIRFMERQNGRLYYRSGGGITVQSDVAAEYQEIIDKIYVPVD